MRFNAGDASFRGRLHESLIVVGLSRSFGAVSFGGRLGAIIDGHVDAHGVRSDIQPGLVGALDVAWRVLSAPIDPLSLVLTAQLGVAHTTVGGDGWTALDVRFALTASRTFFDRLTPYVATRAFVGPVFWGDATGGDTTHLQVAVGVGCEIVNHLSIHVEGAFVAERGLFGGVGYAF